jgi:ubiquinone/menaquinone biosynthesis C-methylase UbiE
MTNKKTKYLLLILLIIAIAWVSFGQEHKRQGVLAAESDNEARLNRLQPPDEVMDAAGIVPGMVIAEIGAGKGRYVVQLAVRVGEGGKIFAEDINAASLDHLRKRIDKWGLENVEIVLGEVTDPKLPEGELDMIFIVSSYHHFSDPVTLLQNARPALKPGGKLAIVEWLPWNDTDSEGTSPEKIEKEMRAAGYKLDRINTFLKDKHLNVYIFIMDEDVECRSSFSLNNIHSIELIT